MAIESVSAHGSPTAEELLHELGARGVSGVLEVTHVGGEVSHVWFRGGGIYAMHVPGYRPALGIRLLSGGLVSPEQLSAAAAQQRERFPTHLIGQVLVTMGVISSEVIHAFVYEQLLDQVADLLDLDIVEAAFHPGRRIQNDVLMPSAVEHLLAVARERRARRADVLAVVGGPHAVPVLGPPGLSVAQTPLGPYDWALLCRVDGRRDITELARVCGFTVQEAAQMVADLALTGLLGLPPRPPEPPEMPLAPVVALRPDGPAEAAEPEWQFEGTDVGEPEPVGDLLAELSAFVREDPVRTHGARADGATAPTTPARPTTPSPRARPDPGDLPTIETGEPVPAAAPGPTEGPDSGAAEPAAEGDATPVTVDSPPMPAPSTQQPAALPGPRAPVADSDLPAVGESAAVEADGPDPTGVGPAPEAGRGSDPTRDGYTDTSVFMRELSSLSDDPEQAVPVVTRLVVPLTEHRRKRRFWSR